MSGILLAVIEDDLQNIKNYRLIFGQDYEIKAATNEIEARALIAEAKSHRGGVIFLMDTSLDGNEGTEGVVLAREIRDTFAKFAEKPLILSTGSNYSEEMHQMGIDHVGKSPRFIEAGIQKYINSRRSDPEGILKG